MARHAPLERSGSPRAPRFPAPRFPARCSTRGLALVTVLWVLVLLSLIAASFMRTSRTEVNLTRNEVENAQAEALAEAGLARALLGLLAGQRAIDLGDEVEKLPVDRLGLGDTEAAPEDQAAAGGTTQGADREAEAGGPAELGFGELPGGALGGASEETDEGWRVDGTVYAWAFGGGEVRFSIQDEGGKIDLNGAPDELLRGLFLSATWTGPDGEILGLDESEADALSDAVRDFADEDDLTRLNGAEDQDYEAAGLPWGAKDAAFAAVEELQQVLGMTAPLYQAVAPALTVHTGSKGIDAISAPRGVLMALPGSEAAAVDAHLAARADAPEGAGPAFLGAEGLSARARRRIYTIHAEGRVPGGAVFAREAVVRLGGARGYRIEAWKQGRRTLFGAGGSAAETE